MADPAITISASLSTLSTPSVCAKCQVLQIDPDNRPFEDLVHNPIEVHIGEAASLSQSDCRVCRIFWNCIKHYFTKSTCLSGLNFKIVAFARQLSIQYDWPLSEQAQEMLGRSELSKIMLYRHPGKPPKNLKHCTLGYAKDYPNQICHVLGRSSRNPNSPVSRCSSLIQLIGPGFG